MEQKKKGNPVIFGIILLGAAISALWQNEHRFDYFKAASDTTEAVDLDSIYHDTLFSFTGPMDQSLTLKGRYVKSFTGYLQVYRDAEIYAWDRDEDDDGVKWTMRWMSYLENNTRNQGLIKKLKSGYLRPSQYQVGDLSVNKENIQFVDKKHTLPVADLSLTKQGQKNQLRPSGSYFYLRKNGSHSSDKLGDERLSFSAISVPPTATYFGKWNSESAVYHQAEVKDGFIAGIIGDKGILHHLVAGDRDTALLTIKSHLKRLKKIVRIIGLVIATLGGAAFFGGLTRFLVFIPVIGPMISTVSGWIGMIFGFIIGLLVIAVAYLTSHPFLLAALILVLAAAVTVLYRHGVKKRQRLKAHLAEDFGYTPSAYELKELEYIRLWQLFASDGEISKKEQKRLDQWTKRHRLSEDETHSLTQRASEDLQNAPTPKSNLITLIRFSLADGHLDRHEVACLQQAAQFIGINKHQLNLLIAQETKKAA